MSDKNYDPNLHEPMPEGEESAPPLTHTMAIVRWAILIGLSVFALAMMMSSLGLAPWEARADDATQYHCPMHPTYISDQPGDCPICGMSLVPIDKSGKEIKPDDKAKDGKIKKSEAKKEVKAEYVCPMHPDVKSDKPGECPKCGMDLVKSENKAADMYVCPMHPDVVSDKPGECPKCGMDLVRATDDKKVEIKKPADTKAAYYCPMHPEVTADKPGRCPKCKMFLEPTSTDTTKTMPMDSEDSTSSGHRDMENMGGMGDMGGMTDIKDMGQAPVPGLVPVTITQERLQLIGIRTAKAELRNLDSGLEIVGYINPDESRLKNVTSRMSGWVQNLFVNQTGQYVGSGQPLLSIYSQDLYQAEQDFMVARDGLKKDTGDESLKEMRQQLYNASREKLSLLGLNDDQINEIEKLDTPSTQLMIRSPFSGYVLEKSILSGQFISPDQNLFTIADLSKVWVLGDIYEKDMTSIYPGQKVSMTLTAIPGETFNGTVDYIYPAISVTTRTAKIRASFANPDLHLRPGMYAKMNLAGKGRATLAVPVDAVVDGGDNQYVFVVHDNTHFEPRLVTVGRSSDDFTEILKGLRVGENVVTSANFLIDSESRLQAAITGMGGEVGHSH